ncbi:unnamed protein product [Ectocarpus sp. 4 AP-2014]
MASAISASARDSTCSGRNGGCSGCSGCTSSGTGTIRCDPEAGAIIFLQQLQQQQQQQQQQHTQPVVASSKAQQHLVAIDENKEGGEKSGRHGGDVASSSSTCDENGEEKGGVGWAPTTTYNLPPIAETAPPASVALEADTVSAGLIDHEHHRVSNMPVLSAGPHFSCNPGSSSGSSLTSLFRLNNKPKQQEGPQRRRRHTQQHNTDSWTPRKGGRDTDTTPPISRPLVSKMPFMLGMLQNAQDQAVSPPVSPRNSRCPGGGSLVVGKGDDESCAGGAISDGDSTAGDDLAGHKRTRRRMGLVGFCGGREASRRNPTPGPVGVNKGRERPPLMSLPINRTPSVDHEEAPRLVGTMRRLRQNSVRIIQRLPGPKLLMQVLEEEIDPKNVQLTTHSEPVILMEVMPAALVISLLALTYLVFASSVFLIVWFHLRGTTTLAMGPGSGGGAAELCARSSLSTATVTTSGGEGDVFIIGADGPDPHSPSAAGCTVFSPGLSDLSLDSPLLSTSSPSSSSLTDAEERYGAVFSGQFSGMTDLFGIVSLHVSFADTEVQESLLDPAAVDIALEACVAGVSGAVGESSSQADVEWGTCEEGWQPVLFQENISARVRSLPESRGYTMFNFYQNQDTIWGQALVRQYRVQVGFVSTTASSSSTGGSSGSAEESFNWVSEAKWSLEYETGATTEWAKIVLAVVLMCWVPVWLAWCWTVFYKTSERGFKNALHERKWLASLGLAVVLYLNPIKVVGNFASPESASWGLASEMCFSVAVVMFLVVGLCIAGGVGRDWVGGGLLGFYVPKVVFGALTLTCMLLVNLVSFPTVVGIDRGSLLAVHNWPESQQHIFAWAAAARIFMVRVWVVWMLFRMCTSGRLLRKLPYVPNRFRQLSYRFFGLQALLLSIVYVMFLLWRLIDTLNDDVGEKSLAAQLLLSVKTRQDHLATVSTLCAYTLQLFVLFLPSSFKESKFFRNIAVRFVYFEEQLPIAIRKSKERGVHGRARGGQARDEDSVFQGGALNPGEHPKTSPEDDGKEDDEDKPVFCVETAAWLLELAWEAYADPIGFKNPHNYHIRAQRLARMGFELVRHIHNVEHDTNCFILKDVPRGRLVVSFRGSVGTKHWMDNLRFFQTEFNLDHMMPTGREHKATKVLDEDIDIQAAKSLHGVVAPMASAREEFKEQPRDANRWDFATLANGATGTERTGSEPTAAGVSLSTGGTVSGVMGDHSQADAGADASGAAGAEERDCVNVAHSDGGSVANASPPSPSPSPSVCRPRGFPRSGLISNAGNLGPPRLVGDNSISLVSDIEEGRGKGRWLRRGGVAGTSAAEGRGGGRGGSISGGGTRSISTESFEGGMELLGRGGGRGEAQGGSGRSAHSLRGRPASFDHAAILEAGDGEQAARSRNGEGRGRGRSSWRMRVIRTRLPSARGSRRGVPGESPGAMGGPNPKSVGRTEHLVRGKGTVFDMLREATRRGMEAVDKAAHAMGINRIPLLKQCLWGQVHTGFWDAYECVRGELHTCIRETVIDWILSQDNPPDIKIYVTGHSMGGALATHCAMDLKLYTVDKIQARLGNFMRVRRTLMQKVAGSPPRHNQQQPRGDNNAGGKAHENGPGGSTRDGRTGKPAPPKNGSWALPRPPPSPLSPTARCKGDFKAAAAAAASGAAAIGGGGQGHNSLQGLVRNLSRRFQPKRGTSAKAGGAATHRDRDESRGDDYDGACSVSSGNGNNDRKPRDGTHVLSRMASRLITVASSFDPRNHINSPTLRQSFRGGEEHDSGKVDGDGSGEAEEVPPNPKVVLRMYSFGAPRAGNSVYAARYNDVVPDSFRVVVDGDPVPGIPTWRYAHAGTQALIDGRGRGSLIIDPSFVEKRIFVRSKRHVLSHLVKAYQAGLRGNLLQAVPPELQGSVPAHWPYGIKDSSSSDSSSDGGANDNGGTGTKERKEEVEDVGEQTDKDVDSEREGALQSSSISARQDVMAQQAVNALKRADKLSRGQSFRLIARSVSVLSSRPTASTSAAGAGGGGGDGETGKPVGTAIDALR